MNRSKFLRTVPLKDDPRFKGKIKEDIFDFPSDVTESISTENINVNSMENWIAKEISKYIDDDFVPDLVIGFLQDEKIKSNELAKNLKPYLEDNTVPFITELWKLLLDAQNNELGIPSIILEESKRAIQERILQNQAIKEKLNQNSDDSSSSSTTSSESDNETHKDENESAACIEPPQKHVTPQHARNDDRIPSRHYRNSSDSSDDSSSSSSERRYRRKRHRHHHRHHRHHYYDD